MWKATFLRKNLPKEDIIIYAVLKDLSGYLKRLKGDEIGKRGT